MYSFPVNIQSILTLAWLASHPTYRETLIQSASVQDGRKRQDGVKAIEAILENELSLIDSHWFYGPVLSRLMHHQVAQIDTNSVAWALRGEYGVYFRVDASSHHVDQRKNTEASLSETEALRDVLCKQVKISQVYCAQLHSSQRRERSKQAEYLRECVTTDLQLGLSATANYAFFAELLRVSLDRINWEEIVDFLLSLPESIGDA